MWKLDEENSKKIVEKFIEFQKLWTLEKVKNMSLEEYTSVKKDNPNRNDFSFWIERELDNIGSIWGGSAFKFGIYKRDKEDEKQSNKGRSYSQNYAWLTKYGNNENEVFNNIKNKIIKIIQASQNNDLEAIEKIDFGDAVKWKIAFHYQNIENIKIVNIFSKDILDLISLNEFNEKLKIYQIHKKLLEYKKLSLVEMITTIAIPLWNKYGVNSQNYIDKMKNLFSEYLSKKNLSKNTINNYIQAIENVSKEFLKENLYSCNLNSFDRNMNILERNERFKSKNSNGNNMYSSALAHYRLFLVIYYEQDILTSNEMQNKELDMENISLNQILYGPPGTGKTYNTIDKALEILGENVESRDEKKAKFDEYVKNGQIVFTTFHQSYGYEEFVEGIKPDLDKENENENLQIRYKIEDGIFKKLCKKALYKEQKLENDTLISNYSSVWKISLGSNASLREECFKENKICIGWNEIPKNMGDEFLKLGNNDKNTINSFKNGMQLGDLVCVFNSLKTIKGIGIIKSDVKYTQGEYQTYREVEWISKDDEVNIYELNDNINLTQKTVYKLWRISPNILLDKISSVKNLELMQDNTKKSFIIIIDEINRGNVSKIFGELITLIEPSKRLGNEEALELTLPYSGEKFGVPKNVYIIGTMNTADRSITSLDTALRRRFEFVEMMPDPEKLKNLNYKDVDLQKVINSYQHSYRIFAR